jgi:hypothetical protein
MVEARVVREMESKLILIVGEITLADLNVIYNDGIRCDSLINPRSKIQSKFWIISTKTFDSWGRINGLPRKNRAEKLQSIVWKQNENVQQVAAEAEPLKNLLKCLEWEKLFSSLQRFVFILFRLEKLA